MFLPIEIRSVNNPSQLPNGEYRASCLTWSAPDGRSRMLEYRYARVGAGFEEARDLLFIDAAGTLRLCDFVRMPDRAWRDSFGARADDLAALLPAEMSEYQLAGEQDLGSLFLEESE